MSQTKKEAVTQNDKDPTQHQDHYPAALHFPPYKSPFMYLSSSTWSFLGASLRINPISFIVPILICRVLTFQWQMDGLEPSNITFPLRFIIICLAVTTQGSTERRKLILRRELRLSLRSKRDFLISRF